MEWAKAFDCTRDYPDRCEIVSICTPPETHLDVLLGLLDRNEKVKGIYCEKPIATILEDADMMIDLCHKRNVILQVNHQRRFGNPKFSFNRGILNNGTHMFDLLRMYFGDIRLEGKNVITPNGLVVEIYNLGDDSNTVFDFFMPQSTALRPLILEGVKHLVQCIKEGKESKSSGEEAREALKLCFQLSNKTT